MQENIFWQQIDSQWLKLALLATFLISGQTYGHGINQVTQAADIDQTSHQEDAAIIKARFDQNIQDAVFSIIRADQVWKGTTKLTVCFGPAAAVPTRMALITRIESIANEWTTDIPIKFDFGTGTARVCENVGSADIRVDISVPVDSDHAVFQSFIGRESEKQQIKGDPPYSMQLLFPKDDPYYSEEVVRFYVLHEFGHALGAGHEHQRLDCKWNYTYVAKKFGFQTAAAARDNLKDTFGYDARAYPDVGAVRLAGYIGTKYDGYSVMKYNMSTTASASGDDPGVYNDGVDDKCYRANWVSNLTDFDRAGMKLAYASRDGLDVTLASLYKRPAGSLVRSAAAAPSLSAAPATQLSSAAIVGLRDKVALVKRSKRASALVRSILRKRAQHQ